MFKSVWSDNNKCWSFGKFHKSRRNVSRMFEEHSTNVCFKNIPRISREYYKVMKIILEVKKFKKLFCGQPPLLQYFFGLYWNRFTFRAMFWKGSYLSLIAGKNFRKHNIIIIIINLLCQVFHISVSSAQPEMFVIARFFDIMQSDNVLQKCLNCRYRGSASLLRRII